MCAAIALSGAGRSSFAAQGGYPAPELIAAKAAAVRPLLDDLLEACAAKAPPLVATPRTVLTLARLAAWLPREAWVRPLAEWEGCADQSEWECLRSLEAHALERWPTPASLHGSLAFVGDERASGVPESAHRAAAAFFEVQVSAGAGAASVRAALLAALGDGAPISKAVAAAFCAEPEAATRPQDSLGALRRAQVAAQGGAAWVGDGVCSSVLGGTLLGDADGEAGGVCEAYGASLISWCVTHAAALSEPSEVSVAIDYALEMRRAEPRYSLAGRTPKSVRSAMDAYARTTVTFDDDEVFQPNPRGLKGLFLVNATIPEGTRVYVPYDEPRNGGPGSYTLGLSSAEGRGARPATVRVSEIGSLRRLIYEGQQLNNCLQDRLDSQLKYVQRARQRVSSFWSFTLSYEGEAEPTYILLAEVWHLRSGNEIRQAEGPRPRTLPGPEAWYWLSRWCEQEGVDLSTWDVYSRVRAPIPRPPVL